MMTSSTTKVTKESLQQDYEILQGALNWLHNTIEKTFSNYVIKKLIPDLKASSQNEQRRSLTEKFVYLFNSLLYECDFWAWGNKAHLKFHQLEVDAENKNQKSHNQLIGKVGKFAKSLVVMDLQLQAFNLNELLDPLVNIKHLFESSVSGIVVTSNSSAIDRFEQMFILSFRIGVTEIIKVDNSRIKFTTREAFYKHFMALLPPTTTTNRSQLKSISMPVKLLENSKKHNLMVEDNIEYVAANKKRPKYNVCNDDDKENVKGINQSKLSIYFQHALINRSSPVTILNTRGSQETYLSNQRR